MKARTAMISPHSHCEFVTLLHSALIASVPNLIPVSVQASASLQTSVRNSLVAIRNLYLQEL